MSFLQLFIPFIGTALGALTVFFFKGDKLDDRVEKALLGAAAGVMIAASFFSLLLPALEANEGPTSVIPVAIGFLLGIGVLLLFDSLLPHLHLHALEPEGIVGKKRLSKTVMMFLAVTLHNVPEGAAAGITFISAQNTDIISDTASLALLVGIAIQNFPEGAIVSLPIKAEGKSRIQAFLYGMTSGAIEPIAAGLMFLLTGAIEPLMPYALAFASGAMIYVVIEELIPDANAGDHSNIATVFFAIGFVLMMVLDVVLG